MRNYCLWALIALFSFLLFGPTAMGQSRRQEMDSMLRQMTSENINDSTRIAVLQTAAENMRYLNLDSALLMAYEGYEQAYALNNTPKLGCDHRPL